MLKQIIYKAFTLAEILIVIGIIGIIAEITIPDLVQKTQDLEYKTAYKRAYSIASQALINAYGKNTLTLCSAWIDSAGNTCNSDNFDAFKAELKLSIDCGTDVTKCWNMSGEQAWTAWGESKPDAGGAQSFIDVSGIAWSRLNMGNSSPEILIDTNGNKGPNRYGKDRAVLVLYYADDKADYTGHNVNANAPIVLRFADFPNADTTAWPIVEQQSRCPSMMTDPSYHCYYQSWITGEN